MNAELKSRCWKCLPKEAREEIRKRYRKSVNMGLRISLCELFGEDNITSDTEPEETLHISRQSVINKYTEIFWNKAPYFDDSPEALSRQACLNVLKSLFGDKCLPDKEPKFRKDEVVRSKSTNKVLKICSNCAEIEKSSCLCVCQDGSVRDFPINDLESEQPSVQDEPKFKYNINDKVILKGSDKPMLIRQRVGFKDYDNGYQITTLDTRYPQWVKESVLKPHTETKDAYEQYKEAKAEEYKNQSKDNMEEKSQEYAEIALKAPWPEAKQAFADAYLAGATEALARQWRSGEEIPNQRLCITKSKDFDNRTEIRFCEWDGENFIDLYDDSVIRPSAFLPIPEPPKDESHV